MGAAQFFLGIATLNELADFTANGRHHIKQGGIERHDAAGEKLEHAKEFIRALDGESQGAAQLGFGRDAMTEQVSISGQFTNPTGMALLPNAARQRSAGGET